VKIQSAVFENAEQSLDIAWEMEQDFEQSFIRVQAAVALNMVR